MKVSNKKCISCGREDQPWFSKKRCKNCATIEDSKPLKRGSTIKKQTEKNKTYRKSQSTIRDVFFEFHISNCKFSEESGVAIPFPSRSNCCHLYDKARHPSVQGELLNFVYLTLDQHTRFDQLLYRHEFDKLKEEFPNAWGIAKRRMGFLFPMVKEETKFKNKFEQWIQSKQ